MGPEPLPAQSMLRLWNFAVGGRNVVDLERLVPSPCRAWLELHSRWSVLRTLGGSNLVKASILMPAFGYILLLNENFHQYLTIKYDAWLLD